jgi:hypothetical protein
MAYMKIKQNEVLGDIVLYEGHVWTNEGSQLHINQHVLFDALGVAFVMIVRQVFSHARNMETSSFADKLFRMEHQSYQKP